MFLSPGDLSNPGIESRSPALQADSLPAELPRKPFMCSGSCQTLCGPMDYSPPGFSAHVILQARILEWVVSSFSKGSSQPRDQTLVSYIASRFEFNHCLIIFKLIHSSLEDNCFTTVHCFTTQPISTGYLIYI